MMLSPVKAVNEIGSNTARIDPSPETPLIETIRPKIALNVSGSRLIRNCSGKD